MDEPQFREASRLLNEHMVTEWNNRITFAPLPVKSIGEIVNPSLFIFKVIICFMCLSLKSIYFQSNN